MPAVVLLHLELPPAGRPVDHEDTVVLGDLLDRCTVLIIPLGEPPKVAPPADDENEEVEALSSRRDFAGAFEDFPREFVQELQRCWVAEIIAAPHRAAIRDVMGFRRATVCGKADR